MNKIGVAWKPRFGSWDWKFLMLEESAATARAELLARQGMEVQLLRPYATVSKETRIVTDVDTKAGRLS